MLKLTKAAGEHLAQKLLNKKAAGDSAMRFVHDEKRGGWAVRVDTPAPSDVKFCHDGQTVLILDQASSHRLRNKVLDRKETDEGPRLRLRGR